MQSPSSILLGEIGPHTTRATLIEPVEGVFRFVAAGQSNTIWSGIMPDLEQSLKTAVTSLEDIVLRRLWGDHGPIKPRQEHGAGFDTLIVTVSAAPALRTAVIGLTDACSLDSARRACLAAGTKIDMTLGISESATPWNGDTLTTLAQDPPDIIVLSGGTDQGSSKPVQTAAMSLAMLYRDSPARVPHLIFAGNLEARRGVVQTLEGILPYSVVDNVRPRTDAETLAELQRELLNCYETLSVGHCSGYETLSRWTDAPIISTPRAFELTARFMASSNPLRKGIMLSDTDMNATLLSTAHGDTYRWVWLQHQHTLASNNQAARQIVNYLPTPLSTEQIVEILGNSLANPTSIAQSAEEHQVMLGRSSLNIQDAFELFASIYAQNKDDKATIEAIDLYAIRGKAFSGAQEHSGALLAIADALHPAGLSRFVVDDQSLLPQLGALARVEPLAALQVLERDTLQPMATLVSTRGRPRGQTAIRLDYILDAGATTETRVETGTLLRIAIKRSQTATLRAFPSRGIDIGAGKPGQAAKTTVSGGGLGLVIDTRGSARVADDQADHASIYEGWLRALDEPLN